MITFPYGQVFSGSSGIRLPLVVSTQRTGARQDRQVAAISSAPP
jgi:hypothetical protein